MPRVTARLQDNIIVGILKSLKPLLSKGCGRGEIDIHTRLKRSGYYQRVTVFPSNFLLNNNNLLDLMSDVSVTRMRRD